MLSKLEQLRYYNQVIPYFLVGVIACLLVWMLALAGCSPQNTI